MAEVIENQSGISKRKNSTDIEVPPSKLVNRSVNVNEINNEDENKSVGCEDINDDDDFKSTINLFEQTKLAKENRFMENLLIECSKRKLPTPEYVLLSTEGPPHLRVFTYQCKLGELTVTASGIGKTTGKHLAAKRILDKIKDNNNLSSINTNSYMLYKDVEPIKALAIFCSTNKIPQPELIQIESEDKPDTFTFMYKLGDLSMTESGTIKSKTKVALASKFLKELESEMGNFCESNNKLGVAFKTNGQESSEEKCNKKSSETVTGLNVQNLNKFCVDNGLPLPVYNLKSQEGPPHRIIFTYECQVGKMLAVAQGTSKKLSSNSCAHKMFAMLSESKTAPVSDN